MALPMLLAATALEVGLASPAAVLQPKPLLTLERTARRLPSTGDPIWDLRLEIPGEPDRHFEAVSGRADRQNANRDRMGSEAPLPMGRYRIGAIEALGRQDP